MKRRSFFTGFGLYLVGESTVFQSSAMEKVLTSTSKCPSFNENVSNTICIPGNDDLKIDTHVSDGSNHEVNITLTNTSNEPCTLNPAGWQLYRREDTKWEDLSPDIIWQGKIDLRPNKSYHYVFRSDESATNSDQYSTVVDSIPLIEGKYAFATLVRWGDSRATSTLVEVVSQFKVESNSS
jgi:hypothetical protein